jgi:probable HAF family extracellular repeat protein
MEISKLTSTRACGSRKNSGNILMRIRNGTKYAVTVVVAGALLASCNNGTSQSGFTPTGALQQGQSTVQRAPNADVPKSVTHYYVAKLPSLGGNFGNANAINDRGWVTGTASLRGNKVQHAVLWRVGQPTDLGTLGGPNSTSVGFDHNTRGVIVGASETSPTDPYAESWCGYGSTHLCQGFRWRNGVVTPLPTLGGNNSFGSDVNNRGQVIGTAETSTQDPSCQAPQVFDYYAVIWQPNGIVVLPPYAGDTVSHAISINQKGQIVGASGLCAGTGGADAPPASVHAVLWQNGLAIDLGSLGGTQGNVGNDINNHGQVVGVSSTPGNQTGHAFFWQNGVMTDLGTLPGDVWSYAYGINNKDQIVGISCDAGFYHCRGFIWQNGSMTDLNLLVPPSSRTYVYYGGDINDRGEIASATVDVKTGNQVAVLLIPGKKAAVKRTDSFSPKNTLPESIHMLLKRSGGMGRPFETP